MSSSDRWGENCVIELEGISISWNIYFHSSKKTDLAKLFFNFIFYKTKQSVVFSIKKWANSSPHGRIKLLLKLVPHNTWGILNCKVYHRCLKFKSMKKKWLGTSQRFAIFFVTVLARRTVEINQVEKKPAVKLGMHSSWRISRYTHYLE